MIGIAVVGAGYWGPNLIRNFATCPATRLVAVCDRDQERLAKALAPYPGVAAVANFEELLARDDVDAVAIATPVGTHAPLGLAALRAGKHLLVEKPLASNARDAEAMVAAARDEGTAIASKMRQFKYVVARLVNTIALDLQSRFAHSRVT